MGTTAVSDKKTPDDCQTLEESNSHLDSDIKPLDNCNTLEDSNSHLDSDIKPVDDFNTLEEPNNNGNSNQSDKKSLDDCTTLEESNSHLNSDIKPLVDCTTLEEWNSHGDSDQFLNYLLEITNQKDEQCQEQLVAVEKWNREQKSKFHPENNNQDLATLKNQFLALMDNKEDSEDVKIQKKEIIRKIATLRESLMNEFNMYNKISQKIERKISMVTSSLKGRTGKSNRARKAGLLNKHAGKASIEGAHKDNHGNAKGSEFDLGVDGAFDSFEIVVLQVCSFTNEHCVRAFQQKGFKYQWHSTIPSPKELALILESPSVCQLWLISAGGEPKITTEHCEVIGKFFRSGGSLSVWGDNEPLFVEANILTQ